MKGYKTMLVNGALAALPVLDFVTQTNILVPILQNHAAAAMSVVGLANMVLRWVTDTPVFKTKTE